MDAIISYWQKLNIAILTFICVLILIFLTQPVAANEKENFGNFFSVENMLMMGMLDLTLVLNNPSGNIEKIAPNDQFQEKIVFQGKLAFFLKGKIKGKYLLAARLDTGQKEINKLFHAYKRFDSTQ